jgi:hypothetical protein
MPEQLTPEAFEPHLGSRFIASDGQASIEMTLSSVVRQQVRGHGDRTEPFSLTFAAPAGTTWPQRTYTFEHADLGPTEIFVVPIGPDPTGDMLYEAVFN